MGSSRLTSGLVGPCWYTGSMAQRIVVDGTPIDLADSEDLAAISQRIHAIWTGQLSQPTAEGIDPESAFLTVCQPDGQTIDINMRPVATVLFSPA